MALELIDPDDLSVHDGYTQVVVASGSRLVFVSGQLSDDAQGNLVGPGDLSVQAHQAFANLGRCLAAAGARPEHVTRLTFYVVGYRPEHLPDVSRARISVFGDHKPADTFLPMEALAKPGYLIEVDAIAVVD